MFISCKTQLYCYASAIIRLLVIGSNIWSIFSAEFFFVFLHNSDTHFASSSHNYSAVINKAFENTTRLIFMILQLQKYRAEFGRVLSPDCWCYPVCDWHCRVNSSSGTPHRWFHCSHRNPLQQQNWGRQKFIQNKSIKENIGMYGVITVELRWMPLS